MKLLILSNLQAYEVPPPPPIPTMSEEEEKGYVTTTMTSLPGQNQRGGDGGVDDKAVIDVTDGGGGRATVGKATQNNNTIGLNVIQRLHSGESIRLNVIQTSSYVLLYVQPLSQCS